MGRCACQDFSNGTVATGFPCAAKIGLPSLQELCAAGCSLNDAAAILVRRLIEVDEIKRGEMGIARCFRKQASDLFYGIKNISLDTLTEVDQQYIQNNLSSSDCADLRSINRMLSSLLCVASPPDQKDNRRPNLGGGCQHREKSG